MDGDGELDATIVCPRCGARAVEVLAPVRASCVPFPELRSLRCGACGQEGTRARIGGELKISWAGPPRR
ncbi:MAG: hypothetical protein KC486_07060 [Myxococcales bacterium]|nr:hypothetical protein [Myxococcales bacterium]